MDAWSDVRCGSTCRGRRGDGGEHEAGEPRTLADNAADSRENWERVASGRDVTKSMNA